VDGSTTRQYVVLAWLTISKHLAELMEAVSLGKRVGKGSTFWFTAGLKSSQRSDRQMNVCQNWGRRAIERSAAEPIISENDTRKIRSWWWKTTT